MLDGVVIGHLWAAQDPQGSAAGYLPVVSALDLEPRIRAVIVWDERFKESFLAGLTSEQALERWRRAGAHPEAGGVPADAVAQTAPGSEALSQAINPDYTGPSLDEVPDDGPDLFPEMDRWSDVSFAPVTLGRTFDTVTDQPVRYLPVHLGDELIGYLWASVTDEAADFQFLLPGDVTGNRARGWWLTEFRHLRESGVTPLQALCSRIGSPEDPKGGRIDADAEERTAPSLDALKEIARR
ncbi:hypothetical protein [Nocardiopsis sp. CC223A]|uniref:hypothetical protein n=1 Tax=Nocardiopsis sp. CC223A TaxID=3044051 RepID=UPI00278C776A|nr:hypothetical protein [Nocardiopsis sp. CC223A]